MRWPKHWSFSFNISLSNEHPGLISFRMDWLDLFAVQGALKSLIQHKSSKASILQRSAFFTVQLSHPYMTTRKTIALTRPHTTRQHKDTSLKYISLKKSFRSLGISGWNAECDRSIKLHLAILLMVFHDSCRLSSFLSFFFWFVVPLNS